ncbi:MAG: carboxypeptidase-like regulatory domain-containing protein [Salibacteraceae bacterium]
MNASRLSSCTLSFLLLFFLFIGARHQVVGQVVKVSGVVQSAADKTPLPYAHVVLKRTLKGAVTNEDGRFIVNCQLTDSLMVTYIGFQKHTVVASEVLQKGGIVLQPVGVELNTVAVYADKEVLLDLLVRAGRHLRRSGNAIHKTYFSLESATQGQPVELIECYFNAEVRSTGFGDLHLKTGRIGMSPVDQSYFVNLSTTEILANYNLIYKSNNTFPDNPLHFGKKQIAKLYEYHPVSSGDDWVQLELISKSGDQFDALITLNKAKGQLMEVQLKADNLQKHPFGEINPGDEMSQLNFEVQYSFVDATAFGLEKVTFEYDFIYANARAQRPLATKGVVLFYDREQGFGLPHYSAGENLVTDYEKIVSQPYDPLFWEYQTLLIPSKRRLAYRQFFKENGVLFNFNELSKQNVIFKNKVVPWSNERIFSYAINDGFDFEVDGELNDYHNLSTASELYQLSAQIYLDRNVANDSVYYVSSTLINLDESFYYLKKHPNTNCFINLYFDRVEMARRELEATLHRQFWTAKQVDSLFALTQMILASDLKTYLREVDHGREESVLTGYAETVHQQLGIDNTLLIEAPELTVAIEGSEAKRNKAPHLELYHYGSAMLRIGNPEAAQQAFQQALELGDQHPWLYYNLGLAYQQLGKPGEACHCFRKSAALGEEVAPEMLKGCN